MNLKPILAVATTIAFVVFHAMTDWSYRPNADDFAGMYFASRGLPGIGYATRFYMEFEGPFLSMIVQGLWMRALYIGVHGGIIISVIKMLLLLSAVYMYDGLIQLLVGKKDRWLALLSGSITAITLYLITSAVDEIWHWVMGTVVYIHPIIFLQIALGLLFRKKFVWAILPLAYLMQSRATYAILLYGLISCVTIYAWVAKTDWRKGITGANMILLACLLIYLFAPGNARRVSTEVFDLSHYLYEYRREIKNVLLSFNLAKMDRMMLGLLAFIPLLPIVDTTRLKASKWLLLIPGIAYLMFVFAHGVLFVYATGYAAWNRVFSVHSFLFFSVVAFYCYMLLGWLRSRWKIEKALPVVSGVATALLVLKLYTPLTGQLKAGKAFSEAYDQRHTVIMSFNGTEADTLFVKPLPQPGVLHFRDLSEDAGYWVNDDFRMRYDIPFQIALEEGL